MKLQLNLFHRNCVFQVILSLVFSLGVVGMSLGRPEPPSSYGPPSSGGYNYNQPGGHGDENGVRYSRRCCYLTFLHLQKTLVTPYTVVSIVKDLSCHNLSCIF